MEKILLIKQPAGIGDIFFCQKIAKTLQKETEYKKVIWPVASVYNYLNEYMVGDIDFVDETENFPYKDIYLQETRHNIQTEDFLLVPICWPPLDVCSCHNNPLAHGHIKYNAANLDYSDWVDYFEFQRKKDKENELIEKLKIDLSQPYRVINKNFGTPPIHARTRDIQIEDDLPNIYMNFFPGATIFDWIKVLEKAKEIHTVEGSLIYILEKIKIDNVFLYSRYFGQNDDFSYMKDNFYNTKWKYIP